MNYISLYSLFNMPYIKIHFCTNDPFNIITRGQIKVNAIQFNIFLTHVDFLKIQHNILQKYLFARWHLEVPILSPGLILPF